MSLRWYRRIDGLTGRGGCRWCHDGDIGDVRDVGHVVDRAGVVGHVGNVHTDRNHGRRAGDHGRCGANWRWNDESGTRTWWGRHEYARRADRCDTDCNARQHDGCTDADTKRWRNEGHARRRPVAADEDHGTAAIFIVGLVPAVAWLGRWCPAPMGPYPGSLPVPITTGPYRIWVGDWRRRFDQHGRRCPCDRDRCRLRQWRLDIHADDGLWRWRFVNHGRRVFDIGPRWRWWRAGTRGEQQCGGKYSQRACEPVFDARYGCILCHRFAYQMCSKRSLGERRADWLPLCGVSRAAPRHVKSKSLPHVSEPV